jgi:methyl-accepting chemotaxis protein
MPWTINRRITLGFALSLILLVAVAAIGIWALGATTSAFERTIATRQTLLAPTQRIESDIRAANVEGLRYLLVRDDRYLRSRDSLVSSVRGVLAQVRERAGDAGQRERWAEISSLADQWDESFRAVVRAGTPEEALRIRATQAEPLRDRLDTVLRAHLNRTESHADSLGQAGSRTAAGARTALLGGALLILIVGILSGWLLSRAVNRPLQETAGVLAASGAQILAATAEQAAGTNESMAAVSQTVATVDEVTQTASQAAQRAQAVADTAQRAVEAGRAGRRAVEESTVAMRAVQAQVESIAGRIVSLAEQAQSIGDIIAAASDIAEQTKLLALNAAVESARAGEHGRGFAVVAAEIKALAGQAKQSTQQVRQILGDIQRATSAAVMATEQGTKQVTAASRQVAQAGEIIVSLADTVNESAQAAAQIVASAGQQAIGMEQIRQAIQSIHDATQQHVAATRQTESAAQELNRQGHRLVALVGAASRPAAA